MFWNPIKLHGYKTKNTTDVDNAWDEIYDNCIASEFFWGQSALEFVGIDSMSLSELIQLNSDRR